MKANTLLLPLVLSLGLAACGQDKTAESPAPAAPMVDASPVAAGNVQSTADAASRVDARSLYAAKCTSCHGASGEGLAGNPKLAGLNQADIASRLKDYRDGKQMGPKTSIMAAMAKPLTDEQIAALASFLGG